MKAKKINMETVLSQIYSLKLVALMGANCN